MKEKKGNQYRVPQNQYLVPQNQTDALVLALKLALTASDEERTNMAVELAVDLSAGMSEFEVARCKKLALQELNAEG